MSDMAEVAVVGGSGVGLGAIIIGLLKWSGSRNISSLDHTIKALNESVDELSREVRSLREKDIGTAKDLESVRAAQVVFEQRIEGLGKYWREQFEEQRRLTHSRMEKATVDLLAAIDAVTTLSSSAINTKKKR